MVFLISSIFYQFYTKYSCTCTPYLLTDDPLQLMIRMLNNEILEGGGGGERGKLGTEK